MINERVYSFPVTNVKLKCSNINGQEMLFGIWKNKELCVAKIYSGPKGTPGRKCLILQTRTVSLGRVGQPNYFVINMLYRTCEIV